MASKARVVQFRKLTDEQRSDITSAVLRSGAAQAERAAVVAECDVDLYAVLEKSGPVAVRPAARDRLPELGRSATALRRKADRKAGRAKLPTEERQAIARAFLDEWMGNIEREIVAHTTQRDDRQASLAATGAAKLDDDERVEVEAHLAENEAALATLTAAHKVASDRVSALPAAPGSA